MTTHAERKFQSDFQERSPARPLSASARIRYRLVGAGCRYHANDNISAFIQEDELQELMTEVQGKMQEVLHALVIDTANGHNTNELQGGSPGCS